VSSREKMLNRIRQHQPAETPLPEHLRNGITFADQRAQFVSVLESVGGRASVASDLVDATSFIRTLPVVQEAKAIVSVIDGVDLGNLNLESAAEPHDLAGVDVAILRGEFAVAENGAIWVTEENIGHRAVYFICQHLVILVPANAIVNNMHEAYERLGNAFEHLGFSGFISGPSKTADIEQSLVIGAQGPRSLTVVLVEGGL
jgi:L-lactate dehydrogenase complex protein LldG